MVMMKVIKICLRCTTMINWTTWNLYPLLICSTTQMNLVCFAGNLGETRSYGSEVASVQVGYMLNVTGLKRRIILCVTFAQRSKKEAETVTIFSWHMTYFFIFP
jgi:hypothetical protein